MISWRGDSNGGIIITTIIITNFYFFCITSVVVIVIMIQHCFSSRWSLKMIVMMIQPLKWLSRHASTIKDTNSLTTLTLRSINYHSLAALRAYSSIYSIYIYNIYILYIIHPYLTHTQSHFVRRNYHHHIVHLRSERRLHSPTTIHDVTNSSICHLWWQCCAVLCSVVCCLQQELLCVAVTLLLDSYFCHQRWQK